ncbi:Nucleoside-diphosphate-sugar epimerase [Devosia crocina]|uniref:Nucleoside-diphosphate-sugar epimerase n=1 Tax=Devosia crocina TaxID=429728 RepID=A0A1I7NIZ4_9HYPH|nr:NAD-dependent epimerase/dehydratase family protein [Devosia crocina]SFV34642.1 Nucleoside-diphosphate-sugar epimerase [Devosia crocina]
MRIFVTGATGYVGGAVVQKLVAQGHKIVGLARSEQSAKLMSAKGLDIYAGDISQPQDLPGILSTVDAVIHTAVGLPRGVTEADAVFAEALIDGLEGTGKPLIFTSGLGVYAGTTAHYVDESTQLSPAIPMQALRVRIENTVLAASKRGVRSLILRPGHVYGQATGGIFVRTLIASAKPTGIGSYIGDGTTPISVVHIEDIAEAFVAALELGQAGTVYNLVSETVFMRELAEAVSIAVGGAGNTQSLTVEQAQQLWGPIAALYGSSPIVSTLRAVSQLRWTAVAPGLLFELTNASLSQT